MIKSINNYLLNIMKIKMIFGTLAMAIIVSVFVSCGNSKNGTINDHDYVDLGLSVKWATCNIGASHPEEFGGYYSWGENSEKDEYNEKTYKWCKGSIEALTKYVDDPSVGENVDNIAVLELADDAAYANWGKPWRMPKAEEWQELFANCRMEFTKLNGIDGVLFTNEYEKYKDILHFGKIYLGSGKVDLRNGDIQIVIDKLALLGK